MDAINRGGLIDKSYPVKDTLFFKLQGDSSCVSATSKTIQAIVEKYGSNHFQFASTDEEAEDLWQNRKYALTSSFAAYPGTRCWTTDVWYVDIKPKRSSLMVFDTSAPLFFYCRTIIFFESCLLRRNPIVCLFPSCHN